MLWTGASWADIPERYGSHTLTASADGAGPKFGTAFWNLRQGLRRLFVSGSLVHEFSTEPKIRSIAIAYTLTQVAGKERERSNQFR